ncbi:hypothetical protein Rmet_2160 [Cupriavidus metallidurans CH34]|uniref:Uncharacterized protein n=2 Tax=Cupriavidus metallidurans TaxID=119219 RepID=Q1LLD7_CUPMC|nr:hypothetical protein Rmet_2160 [Cupriavidus metallidurans CH34]
MAREMYHGSLSESITVFDDFTHFGTRDAAIAAAAAKAYAQPGSIRPTAYLYCVQIQVSDSQIHKVETGDWGDPTLYSTCRTLLNTQRFPELKDIELQARKIREGRSRQSKIDAEKYLIRAMADALQDRVGAFEYTNKVEDERSQSLLVVRGANVVRHGKVEKIEQSQLEAARVHNPLHHANSPANQFQEVAPHIQARDEFRNQRPSSSRT